MILNFISQKYTDGLYFIPINHNIWQVVVTGGVVSGIGKGGEPVEILCLEPSILYLKILMPR